MFRSLGALETTVALSPVNDAVESRPYGVTTGGSKGYE